MNRNLSIALACLVSTGCVAPAAAQNVYRCGNSYSQQPCAEGKLVPASDSRNAGQKVQTDQATQRDAKNADAMEKARLKEEGKPAPLVMPPAKAQDAAEKPAKPASGAKTKKKKKPEGFTAVAPKKPDDASAKKKKTEKKKDA